MASVDLNNSLSTVITPTAPGNGATVTGTAGVTAQKFLTNVNPAITAPQFTNTNNGSAGYWINTSSADQAMTADANNFWRLNVASQSLTTRSYLTGVKRTPSILNAGANSITADDSHKIFVCIATTSTANLPTPSVAIIGVEYTFNLTGAGNLTVTTPAGVINLGTALRTGASRNTVTAGAGVTFVCLDGVNYEALYSQGTWT